MAFKIILIAGEPATGKTTLVRKAFSPEKMLQQFEFGLMRGHLDGGLFIGGIYDGSLFAGTDKLSMAVQPWVINFLQRYKDTKGALVMEGDRVANAKFLQSVGALGLHVHLVLLTASDEQLAARHTGRGDQQSERWLASRRTKIKNLREAARAMPHVTVLEWGNETEASAESAVTNLQSLAMDSSG